MVFMGGTPGLAAAVIEVQFAARALPQGNEPADARYGGAFWRFSPLQDVDRVSDTGTTFAYL